jgi:predicted DNA-binding transcriptional regulator AlpA
MGRMIDLNDLVDAPEIARRTGLSGPQAVHNWHSRHPDFPAPVATYGKAVLWDWNDVKRWLSATGRSRH